MKNTSNSQAGFSLVAVLIVMGVVLFAMLLISQAKFRAQGVSQSLKVKQSYADINQALINNVVDVFHKNIAASCGSLVSGKLNSPQPLDGAVTFKFEKNVPIAPNAPKIHEDAMKRCKSPSSPSGSGNRFYFCVKLEPDHSAPKDSILNAHSAFAEFAVELIDLQTQAPISCTDYETRRKDLNPTTNQPRDGSAGMAVTMALYWANQSGATNKYTYSQKALSYIANQN